MWFVEHGNFVEKRLIPTEMFYFVGSTLHTHIRRICIDPRLLAGETVCQYLL